MKILCFGDSLTTCGGEGGRFSDILQERFPGHEFLNKGVGGEAFPEARRRLQADVLAEQPDIVLVEYGANDWWRDERPFTAWAQDLDDILGRICQAGTRAIVVGVFGPYRNAAGELVPKERGVDERGFAFQQLEEEI
ncbi:MAG TPA: GDSL-type esterase/lipase family protein, partial [Armatimonadota bacterium]